MTGQRDQNTGGDHGRDLSAVVRRMSLFETRGCKVLIKDRALLERMARGR